MQIGAITGYFDVAQVTLYAFWVFFAGVVFYCRREDKREGYPLIPDRVDTRGRVEGFPTTPPAKNFILGHGGMHETRAKERPIAALPMSPYPGAALEPTGNPMIDGVGPASWAMRTDSPDVGFDDRKPKIVPLRVATDFFLAAEDPNPIGMPVVGADGIKAGTCVDVWVDRSEVIIRYLEAEILPGLAAGAPSATPSSSYTASVIPTSPELPIGTQVVAPGANPAPAYASDMDRMTPVMGPRRVLVPMALARVLDGPRPQIRVNSILGAQFANVPMLRNPDQVTLLEEDMIVGYFGGGKLYATAARLGPLL